MDRRTAGIALLVVAVAAALVMSSLVTPGLRGTATVGPLPAAPAVGSCLNQVDARQLVVSCDAPHTGEITRAWVAWSPEVAGMDRSQMRTACRQAGADYLDVEIPSGYPRFLQAPEIGEDWSVPPLAISSTFVGGPESGTDVLGFRACVVRIPIYPAVSVGEQNGQIPQGGLSTTQAPGGQPFGAWSVSQPMTDLIALGTRPPFLRTCYSDTSANATPCDKPHTGEIIAQASIPVDDSNYGLTLASNSTRRESCRALVSELTGHADPTVGGRLTVTVSGQVLSPGLTERDGQLVSATAADLRCRVDVAGRGWLTGSVVGLDGGPLPLQ